VGFQHMKPIVHQRASSKGGLWRKKKGLASLTPERRKQIASMGGTQNAENHKNSEGAKQTKAGQGDDSPRLADILGTLDG